MKIDAEAAEAIQRGGSYIQGKLMSEIDWAIGQFRAIRAYTKDGKVACACADAEHRLKEYAPTTDKE